MKHIKKSVVWAYWVGIAIVFGTHLYILGFGLPASQIIAHAVLNLFAGGLLAYSWFGR